MDFLSEMQCLCRAATQAAQLAAPALGAAVHGLASLFGRKLLGAAAVIAI